MLQDGSFSTHVDANTSSSPTSKPTTTPTANTPPSATKPPPLSRLSSTPKTNQMLVQKSVASQYGVRWQVELNPRYLKAQMNLGAVGGQIRAPGDQAMVCGSAGVQFDSRRDVVGGGDDRRGDRKPLGVVLRPNAAAAGAHAARLAIHGARGAVGAVGTAAGRRGRHGPAAPPEAPARRTAPPTARATDLSSLARFACRRPDPDHRRTDEKLVTLGGTPALHLHGSGLTLVHGSFPGSLPP